MVRDEVLLVARRHKRELADQLALTRLAISSVLSKDASDTFRKTLEELQRE